MSIFDNAASTGSSRAVSGKGDFKHESFFNPILTKDGTALTEWKPKKGDNFFDIIGFVMGTDIFADVDEKRAKGRFVSEIVVDVNWHIKQGQAQYDLISRSNLGLANDPFQDEQARLFLEAKNKGVTGRSDDMVKNACVEFQKAKSLFPKTRNLYLVAVYDETKTKKTFHYYAPAYFSFGKLLDTEKETTKKMGGVDINWGHPVDGPTIYINGVEKSFNGNPFIGFDTIKTMPRIKPFKVGEGEEAELEFVKKFPSLDESLIVPEYDKAYEVLFGVKPQATGVTLDTSTPDVETEATTTAPETTTTDPDSGDDNFEDDIPF